MKPNVPSSPEAELGAAKEAGRELVLSSGASPTVGAFAELPWLVPSLPSTARVGELVGDRFFCAHCRYQCSLTHGLKGSPEMSPCVFPTLAEVPPGTPGQPELFSCHENHQNYLQPGGESVPISREGCWRSDTGDDEGFLMSWLKLTGSRCGVLSFGSASLHRAQKWD